MRDVSSRRSCWSCYWLLRTQLLADRSTCLTRSVGAVAVLDKRVVSEGFNGTLPGRPHCDEGACARCKKGSHLGLEACLCCHAECNLVANAARIGVSLMSTTVYSTTQPCLGCTKLLVASGVSAVVYDEPYVSDAADLQAELNALYTQQDPGGVGFSHFICTCS
jgi:dCMP deaminase